MQPKISLDQEPRIEAKEGLCSTCIHSEGCSLRANIEGPVHDCGEFFAGQVEEPLGRLRLVELHEKRKAEPVGKEHLLGLCMNCDHRDECSLPRPAGGVWHCEEYL